jgi:hypothetical protein
MPGPGGEGIPAAVGRGRQRVSRLDREQVRFLGIARDITMPDAGCRMPDAGCRMPDAGCRMPDAG